ncbi:2-polyprenyl-3-methyl-5-hydroxy-6-metoxy-1,4-benzoquinol methylase [Nocardioides daedukensis]|uniref:2-polyprenyl-3-methyl-5-hydroxy-6-metoxy-1, 4-benzoquinol methylase n=1 Tax=Nocardioides daedukensis TaxID=634462 RepID=A0A7Y9S2Q0_9ACTN|nr:2-polyprenyl-3-methyl-5-hydroxy-6-metoxy-1,4-benzoquinol methylase [Nocardioides daedukensis]
MTEEHATPAAHWEARYTESGKDRIWSGRVNATVADVVQALTPGTALDLGCGEGGDALWLAEQGWQVTGLDISPSAVARASAEARARGVDASFIATDLSTWTTDDRFDLVTAAFFHSFVELPRTEILRRAAERVAPGGHLLLVTHAAPPPWSKHHEAHGHHPEAKFLTPEEELTELDLHPEQWQVRIVETRPRQATGPEGEPAHLDDGVVVMRRTNQPVNGPA